jgi:hypothetical protein
MYKGHLHSVKCQEVTIDVDIELLLYPFFNLGLRLGDGWSTPRPDRFTPVKDDNDDYAGGDDYDDDDVNNNNNNNKFNCKWAVVRWQWL